MTIRLKQSTASQEVPLGIFVDETDGKTAETGLTIANTDIKIWKMGATTLANKNSGGGTHISGGIYYAVLDATDTDTLGGLVIFVHVSGALPVRVECEVLAANVYDSLVAASDKLQVHADEMTAGLITASVIATGAIDADAIADNAIDAGAIASDAITSAKIADNAIAAAKIAADAITAAKIADGAIDAATFAAGAITATVIASNAIDADALASDAVTEIQSGLATSAALDAVDNFIDTEIQTIITMLTGIVPVNGTIGATGNDTTHLHLSGLAYADDGPNSMLLLVKDVSAGIFVSRWIEDFSNTGDLATVATLPFTPEASVDTYWLLPVRADVTGGSGLDAAGVRAALGLNSANLDTQLAAIDDAIDTEVAAILADTNELQTDWVNGGRLDLLIDAIKAKTDNLPTDPADDSDIDSQLSTISTKIDTIDDFLDTEIAAIKAKTDNLPASPAGVADIPPVGAIADAVWDEATTAHTTSGTFGEQLKTDVDAILADTNELQTDLTNGGRLDLLIDAILEDTGTTLDDLIDTEIASISTKIDTVDDFLDTEIAAIKAKTDSLTFTVSGKVDANMTHINETEVAGDGDATPWGPA